jgi:hypothetical protein
MSKNHFTIDGISQELHLSPDQVNAVGGVNAPTFVVPIEIKYNRLNRNNTDGQPGTFKVTSVKAELKITDQQFKCGETVHVLSQSIYRDNDSWGYSFQFLLNQEIITRIEKYRKGNIPMRLELQIQIARYGSINVMQNNAKESITFINGYETTSMQVSFDVEQSHWVNKILPGLGHNSYKLVELPLFNEIIPKEYKTSIVEFEEARKYFINGDYDKTVAHCRAAIDPFKSGKKLEELKAFVKSKSEFEWANKVLDATEEWLDKIIKATAAFTSKTHHAPSIGHFSRTEAEIVLIITTGIIAYIGKIEYKKEE